jgi:cyclophilin family peptidyl-prolyl cis-trans isomerase
MTRAVTPDPRADVHAVPSRRPSLRAHLLCALSLLALMLPMPWQAAAQDDPPNPRVQFITSMGKFTVELYPQKAPKTVENFLTYVKDGFYKGTVFHRVIDGFMIQGGGFSADMQRKDTREPIENEAANGLKNIAGSIAMARTGQPHSATAQFFINVADNPYLDHKKPAGRGWGYAVFGRCVEGMDVVEQIKAVPTANNGPYRNVPVEPVVIKTVKLLDES